MHTAIRQVLAAAAVAASFTVTARLDAEEIHGRISVSGRERHYLMVVPPESRGRKLPAVLALHGALMDGRSMQQIFGLDAIANQEGFVAVYPDGLGRRWNDGRRVPWHRPAESVDDAGFLVSLARRIVDDGFADPKRIYLVGVSNGGIMAFRMACEAPGVFAAFAAIIANMSVGLAKSCQPGRGVPMLIMNSTKDPMIPWGGGPMGFAGRYGRVVSTEDSVEFWRRNNGCDGNGQRKALPDRDQKDGSTVTAQQYNHCRSGAPVVLITIEGGGHIPPGATFGSRVLIESILGKANRDISAADISWKFFRRFPAKLESVRRSDAAGR
jgi:polyhydroxybutyrate depolymerase